MKKPKCPFCGSKDQQETNRRTLYCRTCRREWSDPDEGGDYSNHNPAARLEREDRERGRYKRKRML